MSAPVIVTGDDVRFPVTMTVDDAAYDASGATSVKAALVSADRTTKLTGDIVQDAGASGADWANGVIMIEMDATDTADITDYGAAIIEVQVDKSIKQTWYGAVEIVQGQIA